LELHFRIEGGSPAEEYVTVTRPVRLTHCLPSGQESSLFPGQPFPTVSLLTAKSHHIDADGSLELVKRVNDDSGTALAFLQL
jgi:hypothetical protein